MMKRIIFAIVFGSVLIIMYGASGVVDAGNIKVTDKTISGEGKLDVIGVETLMKSPGDYKGRIKVEGVVRAVNAEKKLIALIDRKEYEECKSTKCSLLTLPVVWNEAMPSIQDEIVFQGEVKEVDNVSLFVAESFEKLPPRQSRKDKP